MSTTPAGTVGAVGTGQVRDHGFLVGGDWRYSAERLTRFAPGTGAPVSSVSVASGADVDDAVRAARAAFDTGDWPRLTGLERGRILIDAAAGIDAALEELARLDAEEAGKPIRLARDDIRGAADLTRYAAGLAMQMHGDSFTNHGPDFTGVVVREPAGVVALITPWNFPALILSQKLPFALGAGCTVVVKPSELTSSSSVEIARIYERAGLPPGTLNLVTGAGSTGQFLVEHPGVDVVSFTGSTATGRRVVQASAGTLKRLSLELGGKAATIVFPDADLQAAAAGVTFGAFFNNGECCVSQSRLLVHESIADDFIAELARRGERLRVGQPLDESTDVGALIHPPHLDAVLGYVTRSAEAGATIVTGGHRARGDGLDGGLFAAPTIVGQVTPGMEIFTNEIFGPVLTATTFRTEQEAVELANAVDYGLSNSVWSGSIDTVMTVSRSLRSGTVYVNTSIDAPPTMPFGGYKGSGIGREMGQAGFDEFTELKSINIRTGRPGGAFPFGAAAGKEA